MERVMKNVLLVDDDSICNLLSTRALKDMGFNEIHTAQNGKQAIDMINDHTGGAYRLPDLLFLDLNMPVMNGFEFLDAFNKLQLPDKDKMKIIVLSSSEDPEDIRRTREFGVKHYLS